MKSFILYNNMCRNILSLLDNEQAGRLFRMIVNYANGEEYEDAEDIAVKMAFEIIRAGLKDNAQAYEDMCEKRRESGRLGGLAKAGKNKQNVANLASATNCSNPKQNVAPLSKRSINNIIQYNIKQNNIIEEEKEESNDSLSSSQLDFTRLLEFFNAQLKGNNSLIPSIKQLSDARKRTLKARVREFGKEALVSVFKKAAASDFLNGKNNRNFVASFDWLLKPTNFPKVLEGNYDNNPAKDKPKDSITSNVNGLIEQVKQEQQQREEEQRRRVISLYNAAKEGDERSIAIIESMRKNGTLKEFDLE